MTPEKLSGMLHRSGALCFGDYTLKDGRRSPFYLDLRGLISNPELLEAVGKALAERAQTIPHDRLAAIPYAGLPIGVAMALAAKRPLIYPRKEAKSYGSGRVIEGDFRSGERVLLIDDVITSGGSKVEAIAPLRAASLVVEDVLVVVDRQEPGSAGLAEHGLRVHSLLTVDTFLRHLHDAGTINAAQLKDALAFLGVEP